MQVNLSTKVNKFFYQQDKFFIFSNNCFNRFIKRFNLKLKIGFELEFYLLDTDYKKSSKFKLEQRIDNFYLIFSRYLKNNSLSSKIIIAKEAGHHQFEIKTLASTSLILQINNLNLAKKQIAKIANKQKLKPSFAGQPNKKDCGSALQINFSLIDKNQKNILNSPEDKCKKLIDYFLFNILENINKTLPIFVPKASDFLRFSIEINQYLSKIGKYNSPTRISVGNNNRTAAIRIIPKERIEYRIPSANCNIKASLAFFLLIMIDFFNKNYIKNNIDYNEELKKKTVFGNVFLEQYSYLPQIITNQQEAIKEMVDSQIIKKINNIFKNEKIN